MADLEKLSFDDRVFLAGSLKTMILADGNITDSELSDIEALSDLEGFDDYEECLKEFEKRITSDEEYWELAKEIASEKSREIILKYLDEVSIQDGFTDTAEKKFLNQLIELWNE
ncbi:MAG: TerB family tellurite resistance protein [Spirochaetales bacterium]|nr:TerB family tellurite resistance protein [Spirochaetales bacterium]